MKKTTHLIGALICTLGALYYSYEYFLRISPSVMESALRAHFGLNATGFGWLSAFYYYAYVPMQVPAGILLDRFGPRLLLTCACLVCVIGTYLFTDTSQFWIAALGRFLVGFGSAFAFVGVLKLSTIWLPENRLAMVAGLTTALGVAGAMVGDNYLGGLVERLGWVHTMHYAACIGIVLTVVLWMGLRDQRKSSSQKSLLEGQGTIHSLKKSFLDLAVIAKSKQIWINGMYGCLVYLPTTVFGELWGIPYLMHAHQLSHHAAEVANSLLFFGLMLGAPTMGYLSDHIEKRKPLMFVGAMGAGVLMTVLLSMSGLSEWSINLLLFGIGIFYSAQCIVFAVGRESSPSEAAATAIAVTNMLVMLGAMLFQPLLGYLLDVSWAMHHPVADASQSMVRHFYTASDYQLAMSIVPIGIFIAAVLVLFIEETHADATYSDRAQK